MTDEELKSLQDAYWARPYTVRWVDSHVSCTNKFNTLDEAFDYVQRQWTNIRHECATRRNCSSNLRRSYLETPTCRWSLREWLLADDVSSY